MTWKNIERAILRDGKLTDDHERWVIGRFEAYRDDHPDVTYRFPRWQKILAWVAGYQYHDYNYQTGDIRSVPLKRKRKLVFNRLRSFARTMLAKLCANTPHLGVVPKTDEYEDIEAARGGDQLIEALIEKLDFNITRLTLWKWFILTNRWILRVYWNKKGKGVTGYTEKKLTDEDTEEVIGQKWEALEEEGEVGIEAVSPFQVRHDPLSSDPKKMRWAMFSDEVDAEELEEEYGLEEGSLGSVGKKPSVSDDPYQLMNTGDMDFNIGTPEKKDEIAGRTVYYHEFWTPKFYIFAAGKKVLESGPHEYGVIPIFILEDQTVPVENYEKGIVFNDSIIREMIPVQREYNRWVSLISLALERASKLKIMTPLDSLISKKQFNDEFGVFIDYNPHTPVPPTQMKLDPLPHFVPQFKTELEREFESVSNIHEASFGRLPERASHASGALVNILLEQDDVVLNPVLQAADRVMSQAWSLVLQLVQDNYTTTRLLRVVGKNQEESVVRFRGADLRGNTDVMVNSQVGLPRGRLARIEYVMKLREAGLLQDDKLVLELIEFGEARRVFQDSLLHERKASRENYKIESNQMVTPEEAMAWVYQLEDHATHLKIHLRDRLSPKWDRFNENQQKALEAHIATHLQILQGQQMPQQQPAEAASAQPKPQPPPVGAPPVGVAEPPEGSIPQEG